MREMAESIGHRVQREKTFSFFENLPKCSPAPPELESARHSEELESEVAPGQNNGYSVTADDLAQMSWALNESVINILSQDEPALAHPDHLSNSNLSDEVPNSLNLFKEKDGRGLASDPGLSSPCPSSSATSATTPDIETPRDLSPEASSNPDKAHPSSKPCNGDHDAQSYRATIAVEIKREDKTPDLGPLCPAPAVIPDAPPVPLLSVGAADESAHVVPTSDNAIGVPDAPASRSRKRKRQTEVNQEDDGPAASSGGRIVCNICNNGRTFFNLQTLKRHYTDVHLKKRAFCPGECRTDSFRNDSLLRHIRTMGPTSECWSEAVKLGWLPRLQAEVKRVRAPKPRKKRRNRMGNRSTLR
ncbi:hypothetical protein ACEPAF_1848 [Sanghuangporus sanghuang]